MAVLPTGIGPVTGGYQIERSLRFNSADSAYLNRTFGTPTSNYIWTWSAWIKRSTLGTDQTLFGVAAGSSGNTGTTPRGSISWDAANTLSIFANDGSTTFLNIVTTPVFRDASAWYHVMFVLDTTQTTNTNRVKIYINGVQQTVTGTYPNQNVNTIFNGTSASKYHSLGMYANLSQFANGYMTEINFIDGQALTPSDFGETDSATGVWKPKKFSGTYGNNGFFLKFADNSGTTSTTLGKDSSGNGNNWTPNNFSVTAGAGNDSLLDTPTQYGTDTGAGGEVRGNYATLNPLKGYGGLLSNGNLDITNGSSAYVTTIAFPQSGKWYCEFYTPGNTSSTACGVAVRPMDSVLSAVTDVNANNTTYYRNDGALYENGSNVATYSAWSTGANTIGVALDMDAKTVRYYLNNTAQGSSARTLLSTTSDYTAFIFNYISGQTLSCNYGQRPFAYTAPSGFKALCTQNLPTPTIGATSTTQANDYFNVVLWTGTGNTGTRAITGVGFQPDFVWYKGRTYAGSNNLLNSIVGAPNRLYSNSTSAEVTSNVYGAMTSFDSDGFTGTQGSTDFQEFNNNGSTYVAWNWKANGAGSTNSNGTAKSSSVTVDSSTDTVTWNSHGMSNGQKIGFFATTMPGGLSAGTLYYVRDAATNTFKVAASSGGAAIDITSNGTTVTAHTTLTSTVSANTTAGFSIVTYTGTGANATVEHGLGVAPKMVIVKTRSLAGRNWAVYHTSLPATNAVFLNLTLGSTSATTTWNSTAPTSTVFSIGTDNDVGGTNTYVAYCFAEVAGYSAFGSYTGNGSADGTFVYTGFRPRYVLAKRSSTTSSWYIYDAARNTYNQAGARLLADSSATEGTDGIDFVSNGFKLRDAGGANSSGTWIYAAFAESPFKYSLAR